MSILMDEEERENLIAAVKAAAPGATVLHNDEHLITFSLYGIEQIVEAKDRPGDIGIDYLAGLIASAWEKHKPEDGT